MILFEQNVMLIFFMIVLLLVVIFFVLIYYYKKSKKQAEMLAEKDEKITFLRKLNATNEHRFSTKEHAFEKEMLALKHTVDTLEHTLKNGTKNQVVLKIESLQHKREQMLRRAGLSET